MKMKLPPMKCRRCGGCCGPVPCSEIEQAEIVNYVMRHDVAMRPVDISCVFLLESGGCGIYEVRPYLCRLFGHVAEMPCAHELNVNISKKAERVLRERYRAELNRGNQCGLWEIPGIVAGSLTETP